MQPLQYDLRDPAAKDDSIFNAAEAENNLDGTITMQFAEEIVAPNWSSTSKLKKIDDFGTLFNTILEEKSLASKGENLLTHHCRTVHAATPIRFTKSSCKKR